MKLETFLENFEILADTYNGVQKMRELILQLAVRGKLIPQDDGDEPASILLKSIRDQIKKSSNSIEENEMLYNIPKTWEFVRLGDILVFEYGDGLPKSKRAENENAKYPVYGSNGIVGYHDEFLIDKPGIIVGRKGSCGALNICFEPFWATDVSYYIIPPTGIDLKFAYILLKSLNLERLGKGIKPGLNRNEAYQVVTSLPPYKEQHRIVAKVDQLMSLCDELETRQQKKRESRAHINSSALDRLLAARAPGEFAEGWRRISDNFNLLYDAPENVGALRKAILQLAVIGKLVEQDEKDESAAVLLERIKEKKDLMIKEKKIKKEHSFENITEDDVPFGLPKGWAWCRVGDIATIKGGKRLPNGTILIKVPTNHIYIRVTDMKNGTIDDSDLHYITNEVYEKIKNYVIEKDDLYLTIVGSTIGKLGIVPDKFHKMNLTENAARIIIYEVDRLFINYAMNSQLIQKQFFDKTKQLGQPKLALNRIVSTFFPLPPLAEQHRIVAKIDQLMYLCDELEAGLMRSQADSEKLMEAVVGRMLARE
nr:MAG: restriction endonuclease subunit S [Candidatus Methanoperedens sp.]